MRDEIESLKTRPRLKKSRIFMTNTQICSKINFNLSQSVALRIKNYLKKTFPPLLNLLTTHLAIKNL